MFAAGHGQPFCSIRQFFQGLPVPLEKVFHGVIVNFPQLERAVHNLVAAYIQDIFFRNLVKTLYGKLAFPLAVHDGGLYQNDNHQGQQTEDGVHLSVMQDGSHDGGQRKGSQPGHEPAGNHRQHAGYTVNRALPSPCLVRQRGAHRHHERHVRGGKRELPASSPCNQQGSNRQVHRGANQVKCHPVLGIQGLGGGIPLVVHAHQHAGGNKPFHPASQGDGAANDGAGGGDGAETLNTAFTLPGKFHAGGDHRFCLFGEPQGKNHHAARGEQNIMVYRHALPRHQTLHGGDG